MSQFGHKSENYQLDLYSRYKKSGASSTWRTWYCRIE